MSRESQQLIRVVSLLLRATRGRASLGVTIVVVVAAVGYHFARPAIEQRLGVSLPAIGGAVDGQRTDGQPTTRKEGRSDRQPSATPDADPSRTAGLKDLGRGVFESPAGVRYTRGSQHGHRLKHLVAHASDLPDRPGKHGVFDADDPAELVGLIDEAFTQAESGVGTRTRKEDGRVIHTVDLGRRVGYIGGEWGGRRNRPAADHLQLVLQGRNLITAYPILP